MSQRDAVDGAQMMRVAAYVGPACFAILTLLWVLLLQQKKIPPWLFVILLVTNIPISAGVVWVVYHAVSGFATGFARAILAGRDIAPPRTYPHQEVLIAQGKYADAADLYRDHLVVDPQDNGARLRLADLLETRLGDYDGAERLYLDVRKGQPDARDVLTASNALIDLYRKTGRQDRLKVELARFAERYRGSPAGDAALRELKALKAEGTPRES